MEGHSDFKMRMLKRTIAIGALAACAAISFGQRASGAENALVGVKLYDTGIRVIQLYGTPDDIQPVGGGGSSIGPRGGGGGRGAGAPGPAGGGGPSLGGLGPAGGPSGAGANPVLPGVGSFSFENDILMRQVKGGGPGQPGSLDATGSNDPGPGSGGGLGMPGGGGRGGGAMCGSGEKVIFTRWIYKRGGSRYGFIMDNGNRVVQIEAIGLFNRKVRTRKGVGFGATFADVIKKYRAPDGYEINGEQIVVRYLARNKVAFRLSRLGPDQPHVVTAIVVAAGRA